MIQRFDLGWPTSGMNTDIFGSLKLYRVFKGLFIYLLLRLQIGIWIGCSKFDYSLVDVEIGLILLAKSCLGIRSMIIINTFTFLC